MPRLGRQTWEFQSKPAVIATATVAGQVESEGPLGSDFDVHGQDNGRESTWEKMEQNMFSQATELVLQKAKATPEQMDLIIGADLNAQLTSFYFSNRAFTIPALGVYSACSSVTEALAVAGLCLETGYAERVIVGTSSHNSTAERQFRYPTEYGAQKPPTAQRTVTGAGTAFVAKGEGPVVLTHATIGIIQDYGIKNPWEYGAAMAPAAESTIAAHLAETGRTLQDYDCVATGDLGRMGNAILQDLLTKRGLQVDERLTDCGILIYDPAQPEVFSGGSGAACSALVTFGHFYRNLLSGKWRRVLVAATGALLSTVTAQQSETIPAISHAIVLERKER